MGWLMIPTADSRSWKTGLSREGVKEMPQVKALMLVTAGREVKMSEVAVLYNVVVCTCVCVCLILLSYFSFHHSVSLVHSLQVSLPYFWGG